MVWENGTFPELHSRHRSLRGRNRGRGLVWVGQVRFVTEPRSAVRQHRDMMTLMLIVLLAWLTLSIVTGCSLASA